MHSVSLRALGRMERSSVAWYHSYSMAMWVFRCCASPWSPSIGLLWTLSLCSMNFASNEIIIDLFVCRFVMITHHSSYARIYKSHWIACMIIFCWVFSFGMLLPTYMGVWGMYLFRLIQRWRLLLLLSGILIYITGSFGYEKSLGTCSIIRDASGHSSKTLLFVIAFVIPCVIIIGCYTKIFWVVHE